MARTSTREKVTTDQRPWFRRKLYLLLLVFLLLAIGIGLGVGLGLGLKSPAESGAPIPTATATVTPGGGGTVWQPAVGSTWQIVLQNALPTSTLATLNTTWANTSIFDIDLFTNPATTLSTIRDAGKKVICYFSAGSYEPDRPDSAAISPSDKGLELDGWPGEYWLNTSSAGVRRVMLARLDLARSKGCDGVDPDNVDAYDNDNGLDLTRDSAVEYLAFLAAAAHARGLSIGLKNAGDIIGRVIDAMQWEVNEQCVQYDECDLFRPFIEVGKPVFAIEYPSSTPDVSVATKSSICGNADSKGFSTLLKKLSLDEWVEPC